MSRRNDDRFRVRPGAPKQRGDGFVNQVLRQTNKAGAKLGKAAGKAGQRPGSRLGRGHVAARFAGASLSPNARRATIKARLVNLAKAGPRSTPAHLRYIEREGVDRQGGAGHAYGPATDSTDTATFEERGREDRHQFRFIVSPEDAEQLDDLRTYTRHLMARMEADLGTRLDWVAVDHWNTDNPHTHVVLRGKDDTGKDLIISRDYIAHGMRHRAAELATEWLGPRTELEIQRAMNITLVVVFVCILLMGGVVEKLFREFSITLAAAMVISLVISLSLTPALSAQLLKSEPKKEHKPGIFDDIKQAYSISLGWALNHSRVVILILAAVIGLNIYLYVAIPKTMLPEQDTGQMTGFIRGDDGFSFQIMQPKIQEYRQLLLNDPAIEDVFGASGGGNGMSNAWMRISLKPMAERGVSVEQVVDRLRRSMPTIPGAILMINADQDIRLSSPFSRSEQELMLLSDDLKLMHTWAAKITTAMEKMPELTEVDGVRDGGTQQVVLTIDREAAQRLGVNMGTVASMLNNSFSQRQVSTMYDEMNQYRVVMELEPGYTASPAVLDQLQVITSEGKRVPLSTFSSFGYGLAEDRVRHSNQFASESIGYGVAEGFTDEQARTAIENKVAELMVPNEVYLAPAGSKGVGWGPSVPGLAQDPVILIACVLLAVYLILGILYESSIHPLTILSTLPSAGIGALLALRLTDTPFSLIAMLGLFLLIGIVMKNAILMIDFALELERKEGLSSRESIFQAALLRLRPIMMTNLAGLLGALPLILSFNEGSELRTPLGITIIGGLAVSQLLTLFTTPVVYLYMEKLRNWGLRKSVAHA